MSILVQQLKAEIEATAAELKLSPSTVGFRAGQGGKFYSRLAIGKSVRTGTYEEVMARLQQMRASVSCDVSHTDDPAKNKGAAE